MCVSEREGKRQKKTSKKRDRKRAESLKNGEDSLYSYDAQKLKNKAFLCVTAFLVKTNRSLRNEKI